MTGSEEHYLPGELGAEEAPALPGEVGPELYLPGEAGPPSAQELLADLRKNENKAAGP